MPYPHMPTSTTPAPPLGYQSFDYTFTGSEGVHFTITMPLAMPSTNYGVTFGASTDPNTFTFSYDTKTTTTFMLRTSTQIPAGKIVTLFVLLKTA